MKLICLDKEYFGSTGSRANVTSRSSLKQFVFNIEFMLHTRRSHKYSFGEDRPTQWDGLPYVRITKEKLFQQNQPKI